MKRFLTLLPVVVLSSLLGMGLHALAAMADDELLQRIFEEAGVETFHESESEALEDLSNDETGFAFEHLYLFMLQTAKTAPQESALQRLSEIYSPHYTVDELRRVVLDGSIADLKLDKLAKQELLDLQESLNEEVAQLEQQRTEAEEVGGFEPTALTEWTQEVEHANTLQNLILEDASKGTQIFALEKWNEINHRYGLLLEQERQKDALGFEALAQEMFYNNDPRDSAGIDLLVDLNDLHQILFNEPIAYPDRNPEVDLASESGPQPQRARVVLAAETEEEFSPYACWDDEELRDSLEEFEGEPSDPEDLDEPGDPGEGDGVEEEDPTEEEILEEAENSQELLQEFRDTVAEVLSTPGDWSRPLPCDQRFCIKINLVTGNWGLAENQTQDTEFEVQENCVACHISYIRERLEDMLDKSVVANKVSMNVFEDAMCKEAGKLVNLDLNVFTVKKPIDLDPGLGGNLQAMESSEALKKHLANLNVFPEPGDSKDLIRKTQESLDCESRLSLQDLSDFQGGIEELLKECDIIATNRQAEAVQSVEQALFEAQIQSSDSFYEQVAGEFYSLYRTLSTFEESLRATYLVEGAPLPELLNTDYCK